MPRVSFSLFHVPLSPIPLPKTSSPVPHTPHSTACLILPTDHSPTHPHPTAWSISPSSMTVAGPDSLCAAPQIMKYAEQRIPTLNEYCVVCDEQHVFQNGSMLKVRWQGQVRCGLWPCVTIPDAQPSPVPSTAGRVHPGALRLLLLHPGRHVRRGRGGGHGCRGRAGHGGDPPSPVGGCPFTPCSAPRWWTCWWPCAALPSSPLARASSSSLIPPWWTPTTPKLWPSTPR